MEKVCCAKLFTNLGKFGVCFGEILLLCFLQEVWATSDCQDDAVRHAVVMDTEVHSPLKVSGEQCLGDQPVHV